MVKKIIKWCNTCQKKEDELDNCDRCKKEFFYQCLGRIENHLYCDTCYRQKEGLKNTDQLIKTTKGVNIYKKNETRWKNNHLFLRCKKGQSQVKFIKYSSDNYF